MLYRKFDYKDIHQILAMKIFIVSPDDHIKQMRRREDQGGDAEKEGIEEQQDGTEVEIDETAKQEVIADFVRRYPLFSSLSISISPLFSNQVDVQKILQQSKGVGKSSKFYKELGFSHQYQRRIFSQSHD